MSEIDAADTSSLMSDVPDGELLSIEDGACPKSQHTTALQTSLLSSSSPNRSPVGSLLGSVCSPISGASTAFIMSSADDSSPASLNISQTVGLQSSSAAGAVVSSAPAAAGDDGVSASSTLSSVANSTANLTSPNDSNRAQRLFTIAEMQEMVEEAQREAVAQYVEQKKQDPSATGRTPASSVLAQTEMPSRTLSAADLNLQSRFLAGYEDSDFQHAILDEDEVIDITPHQPALGSIITPSSQPRRQLPRAAKQQKAKHPKSKSTTKLAKKPSRRSSVDSAFSLTEEEEEEQMESKYEHEERVTLEEEDEEYEDEQHSTPKPSESPRQLRKCPNHPCSYDGTSREGHLFSTSQFKTHKKSCDAKLAELQKQQQRQKLKKKLPVVPPMQRPPVPVFQSTQRQPQQQDSQQQTQQQLQQVTAPPTKESQLVHLAKMIQQSNEALLKAVMPAKEKAALFHAELDSIARSKFIAPFKSLNDDQLHVLEQSSTDIQQKIIFLRVNAPGKMPGGSSFSGRKHSKANPSSDSSSSSSSNPENSDDDKGKKSKHKKKKLESPRPLKKGQLSSYALFRKFMKGKFMTDDEILREYHQVDKKVKNKLDEKLKDYNRVVKVFMVNQQKYTFMNLLLIFSFLFFLFCF